MSLNSYKYQIYRFQPWVLITLIGFFILSTVGTVIAHPAQQSLRYVAPSGNDHGACQSIYRPCRTIPYAVSQAEKGDEVRVAAGSYYLPSAQADLLFSQIIRILGGYSETDGFQRQAPTKNPTIITGVAFTHRAALEAQGFRLLQDVKGWPTEDALTPSTLLTAPQTPASCINGLATIYPCHNIDFVSQLPLAQFSSRPSMANDIWGHVDLNDQREYALIGLQNGTAIVDVTAPENPREIATIPGLSAIWRDIKVYQFYHEASSRWNAYAYVTTDFANQGLQIIDLTGLPDEVSLAATYTDFTQAHNIYLSHVDYTTDLTITGQTAYAYILGSNLGQGAFRILDLRDPVNPVEVTAPPPGAEYSHDATTLVITDTRTAACATGHNPCELFIDFNEDTVDIWDITDKLTPMQLSSTAYEGAAYAHSGWWSVDKRFIFIQDESDERRTPPVNTVLRTLDITDLTAPFVSHIWQGETQTIDHNGFVKGNRYYMSNYERGLTILDITNPNAVQAIGFFDTYPASDAANYNGAWGIYPYLPSGTLLISDIQGGLILVKESTSTYQVYWPLIMKQ